MIENFKFNKTDFTKITDGSYLNYSFNKSKNYGSNLSFKIRRSSDDATQDILLTKEGFPDLNQILYFVGSGSGYVDTIYEKNNSGLHLTQVTTALQPRVVNSGSLDLINGKLRMYFALGNYLVATGLVVNNAHSIFCYLEPNLSTAAYMHAVAICDTTGSNFKSVIGIKTQSGEYVMSGERKPDAVNPFLLGTYLNTPNIFAAVRASNTLQYIRCNRITQSKLGTTSTTLQSLTNLYIGINWESSSSVAGDRYRGYTSDISIYNYALTEREITEKTNLLGRFLNIKTR